MRGLACLFLGLALPVAAQDLIPPPARGPVRLSGPRTGITVLLPEAAKAFDHGTGDRLGSVPVITQLGWQVETRVFQLESGLTGMTESVMLVGGLDRGLVIPSVTFLVALRTPSGIEAGLGPNLTVSPFIHEADDIDDAGSYARIGLALATGVSPRIEDVNLPVNVAAVLNPTGLRLSVLVGFNVSTYRY